VFPFCIYYDEDENNLKQVFSLPTVEEIYTRSNEPMAEPLHYQLLVDNPDGQWFIPNDDPSAWIANHTMRKRDGRHTVEFTVHGHDNKNVLTILDQPTVVKQTIRR
jgi:hypothetical protein